MIRLNKINIIGFKDPTFEKELIFSTEPISVIYGENGSGKTTLLKILFAVLSKDEKILLQENVIKIEIDYQKDEQRNLLVINKTDENKFDWTDNLDLYNSSSILFGVHRGVIQEKTSEILFDKNRLNILLNELRNVLTHPKFRHKEDLFKYKEFIEQVNFELNSPISKIDVNKILYFTDEITHTIEVRKSTELHERLLMIKKEIEYFAFNKTYQTEKRSFLKKIFSQRHLSTDFVKIIDIQNAIVAQFQKGQNIVSDKIKKAFFETIEKAVEIDETGQDFVLPNDFEERIKDKKNFILKAIPKENSSLTERIKEYLETGDNKLTEKSRIFRAMLLNIIESAEEPNPTLEAITKLIEIFNEHLYKSKKLIVDLEKSYIDLGNNKFHNLSELSSGERNLLSLLTLFLIIGNDRIFLMIDEPEISLNIKWQRDFLPLLSRLNSKAQIIVASHSPSIAHKNSKYLVELK